MGEMTLEQKIALCSGKNQWETVDYAEFGIPSIMMSDGPNGLRKQEGDCDMLGLQESVPSTSYPTASIAACSFDRDLLREYGKSLGTETKRGKVSMILGPGVNIKRNPLCGRNFEYFSEDPYLAGQLGEAYVRGVQETGTGACLKHFACNNQEYFRMTSDSLIDEKTLREIYLSAFENVVRKSKPRAVMAAYNKINGTYCCSDKKLLTDILREEWGYGGMVVTDWTAVEDRTDSFRAGCDLVMPGGNGYGEKEALEAVKTGKLDKKYVEQSAERINRFVLEGLKGLEVSDDKQDDCKADFHSISGHIAEHSAVLLKNEDRILPLKDKDDICFIGQMAEDFRYQGYGSSKINPVKLDQIRQLYPDVPYSPGYRSDGSSDDDLINNAVKLASKHQKTVIFAGLPGIYESEGYDRPDMRLPRGHERLIEAVAAVSTGVIVVLLSGSAVEVPWIDDVNALLYMGLAGEAGAAAAMRLLTGAVNPSGKLAETWPVRYEDTVNAAYFINGSRNAQYREGIYVGYRYFEKAGKKVRFPFGYGLSYTEFEYCDISADLKEMKVTVSVKNTGSCPGEETALLFAGCESDGSYRAVRELRGFEKVYLNPGEEKKISIDIDPRAFMVWQDGWTTIAGRYTLQVTGDPTKTGLTEDVVIEGEELNRPAGLSDWYVHPLKAPDEKDFLTLYNGNIPEIRLKPYTINSNIVDMLKDSWLLRIIYYVYEKRQAKQFGRNTADYRSMMIMADECPLRSLQNNLLLKNHAAQALADMGNKKYISMFRHLFN